jgi:uncharacterized membrane protein (DUF2068 family)
MNDPATMPELHEIDAVHAGNAKGPPWTTRLLLFLRAMSLISMLNGLRYWAALCGFAFAPPGGFEAQSLAWQTATIFFAVIDLVAAVGLWLAAPWGAVVWLTSAVSMLVVEGFFPQIYGGWLLTVLFSPVAIIAYLVLAIFAAREQPQ